MAVPALTVECFPYGTTRAVRRGRQHRRHRRQELALTFYLRLLDACSATRAASSCQTCGVEAAGTCGGTLSSGV
jgi:hypothetical protein